MGVFFRVEGVQVRAAWGPDEPHGEVAKASGARNGKRTNLMCLAMVKELFAGDRSACEREAGRSHSSTHLMRWNGSTFCANRRQLPSAYVLTRKIAG